MAKKVKAESNGALVPADDPLKQRAAKINALYGAHQETTGAALMFQRRSLQYRIDIAEECMAVKEDLRHGSFLEWIRQETVLPARTAQHYMANLDRYRGDMRKL